MSLPPYIITILYSRQPLIHLPAAAFITISSRGFKNITVPLRKYVFSDRISELLPVHTPEQVYQLTVLYKDAVLGCFSLIVSNTRWNRVFS